ncbi:hypothetical protein [Paractinoplanes toevensis]|uniref:Uncharacterized protein n=1 Tax=Paractinoplanes toevensis TaxID=571911 RepID=A0A919T6P8_9ACTN|nr:hypothetical protein [Actinoplanes toevensis]GIM88870.1 hypothetical protein Ato02nite_006630 [Actinoplanes toevensis]
MTSDRLLPAQINWACGTCKNPILTGVVHLSFSEINQAVSAREEYERRSKEQQEHGFIKIGDLASLMSIPRTVRWAAVCDGCRRLEDHHCGDCYAIEVTQMRSVFSLFKWTRHLHKKSWFGVTDWIDFAADIADANGPAWESTGVR